MLYIYTDGSCMPNPGQGGWAFVVVLNTCEIRISGYEKYTTNNKIELTAVIEALRLYENTNHTCFHFYTDSQYVINCATGKWKKTKNIEEWNKYIALAKNKNIKWTWVKGHNGDKYNEIVDEMAKNEIVKKNNLSWHE